VATTAPRFLIFGIFSVVSTYISIRCPLRRLRTSGELSQPPHPTTSNPPVHYSPSSHFSQLALPDEAPYRGDQGRSSYPPSHGHAQASSHGQLRPLATLYHSPPRAQPPTHAAPSTPSRPAYSPDNYSYNPEPSRSEEASRGIYTHDLAPGTAQYSYPPPPPPPPPPHQGYTSSATSRVPPTVYPYARSMASVYSDCGPVLPSGPVASDQPPASSAKYGCTYCGKGFTRPSSLRVRLLLTVSPTSQKRNTKTSSSAAVVPDSRSQPYR
jgi:hypothetical protein